MKEKEEVKVPSSLSGQIDPAFLGKELARVLLGELRSDGLPEPASHDRDRWIKDLQKDIPKRGGVISFRTIEGQDAPKWEFAVHVASDPTQEDYKRLFCMAHGEFIPSGDTASEHVYPYAHIRDNQQRLLNFLNADENKAIADSFLLYPHIAEYLRRDENGVVSGTTYFYKQCYNIMDNLFLMCQSCNSSKGDNLPLSWFEGQRTYFGAPFIEHIDSLGGLHEGILLPRVYREKDTDLPVQLSAQTRVRLPSAGIEARSLGIVVQEWFFDHYGEIFRDHQQFYTQNFEPLKAHLEHLGALLISENEDKVKEAAKKQLKLRKEMKRLTAIQQSILARNASVASSNLSSQSTSSESSEVDQIDTQSITEAYISERQIGHATHNMRNIIRDMYDESLAKEIYAHIGELRKKKLKLPGSSWQNILAEFGYYMADVGGSEKEADWLAPAIKSKISELYEIELRELGFVKAEILEQAQQRTQALEQELAELRNFIENKTEVSPIQDKEESPPKSPLFFSTTADSKKDSEENKKRKRESDASDFDQESLVSADKKMKK